MPYTPPSHQSPASSITSSPTISRTSSYHEDVPRSPISRPTPPRSMSSASYLHKHRRSPSIPKTDGAPPTPTEVVPEANTDTTDFANMSSVRQSPPPVSNLRMPTQAVLSPPDSSENSDGDENSDGSSTDQRGRELEKNWQQLQLAIRALPRPRDGSPQKAPENDVGTAVHDVAVSAPHTQPTSPTMLSTEARKISHSRSSTETKIMLKTPTFAESSTGTSDDSEDEDNLLSKPALVRKKSGELVKPALRPSSRRRYSSMPGTPTYAKSVHFNDNDNQTRHFLQVDKPIAVSAGTSPVETYDSENEFPFEGKAQAQLQIKVAHMPEDSFERRAQPVRVERIYLSSDKATLIGTCAVQNIAFQKLVVARFTLDYWKTTSEVVAEYGHDGPHDGCDRFNFNIRLTDQANIASKTMLLCVRYNVGGQEYWDNNRDTNYQIDFSVSKPIRPTVQTAAAAQRPHTAIPRSRHSSPITRSKSHDSIDDDFVSRIDSGSYNFSSPESSIKLKPKPKRSSMFTNEPPSSPNNGLGSRYDFGSSLSAALSSAQDKLGRESGLMGGAPLKKSTAAGSYFGLAERKEPAKSAVRTERPDALTTDRPAIGSDQYRDLVQKFCYFTPAAGKGSTSPQPRGPISPAQHASASPVADMAIAESSTSTTTRPLRSFSPAQQLDGTSEKASPAASTLTSRSTSPGAVTGGSHRPGSPVKFIYPYHSSHRDGYLSDAMTPTAIQG